MTTKIIKNDHDRAEVIRLIQHRALPITVNILKGVKRTSEQNRLQRLWCNETAEQLQDQTAEEYRAYCKLHFGVPILRNENPDFCEKYDRIIRPLSYPEKLELMAVPFDFPVTRRMTTKQKKQYLEDMQVFFTGLGVKLTEPKKG